MCRNTIRKAKVQMELNMRDVKNNKHLSLEGFDWKRQEKRSIPPLINKKGELALIGVEKTEMLPEFFAESSLAVMFPKHFVLLNF